MPNVLVRHTVKDYAKWRPVYDEHGKARKAAGEKSARVFRTADEPNHIVMLFEWDSVEHAHAFMESADLRQAMSRAGVTNQPEITFLNDVS